MVQLSHPYMTTGKTIALTIKTFVSKVISLLCNTVSMFVIAFIPRSKHLLIYVKEESENVGLKLSIQKTKIMASGPVTSWEIDGEKVETVSDFIFLVSKITADGDCSHEIKRHLLLGRKIMTNLDSIFKGRDINLPTKVHLVKAMVFPVVIYGCESWTVKKAECQRIDAFELWCWRTLESSMDCKEIQPVHSKGDQPWVFFGRNDAKAETPVLWPPHVQS